MKRIISLILAILMLCGSIFALAACDGKDNNDDGTNDAGSDNGNNGGDNGDGETEAAGYEVKVVDNAGNPVSGVKLAFILDGKKSLLTTDASGVAKKDASGNSATVSVFQAEGYIFDKDKTYTLVNGKVTITLEAESSEKETFTIYVVDATGAPVANVDVQLCKNEDGGICIGGVTDASGKAVFEVTAGSKWKAKLISADEYEYFADGSYEITLVK